MTMTALWSPLALLGLTGALVGLPFVPVWREWRKPRDDQALPLSPRVGATGAEPAQAAESHSPFVLQDPHGLRVPVGTPFVSLTAPTVWIGARRADMAWQAPLEVLQSLPFGRQVVPGAQPWGPHGARVEGDCLVPAGSRLQGPLLVLGDLHLGEACVVQGDIKAHGDIALAARCTVQGALVAGRSVQLGASSTVQGPVLAERHLHVARFVRIGTPAHPSTASAGWVSLCSGSVVHGQVLAREAGVVL